MGMFDDMLDEGMHRTQVVMQETGLDYETARRVVTGQEPYPKEKPKMKIYIAGPMRGYPNFNFAAFADASQWLRAKGYEVFNPAESDNEKHGTDIGAGNATGSEAQATAEHGFSLREALGRDAEFITQSADAIYMLAGWENSTGAQAEWALARAMKLLIFYQTGIEDYEWKEHFDGTGTSVTQ